MRAAHSVPKFRQDSGVSQMTDSNSPERNNLKWVWGLLIAALGFVLIFVLLDPGGDPEDSPITDPDPNVGISVPADVPTTGVNDMAAPEDDRMVTRIDDETAGEAATPEDAAAPERDLVDVAE